MTRRDEIEDILEQVWNAGLTPKQAMAQLEPMIMAMVQTAIDAPKVKEALERNPHLLEPLRPAHQE